MNFQTFLVGAVLLAVISPMQFFAFGQRLIDVLYPLAERGLTLAIVVAGIMFLIKK